MVDAGAHVVVFIWHPLVPLTKPGMYRTPSMEDFSIHVCLEPLESLSSFTQVQWEQSEARLHIVSKIIEQWLIRTSKSLIKVWLRRYTNVMVRLDNKNWVWRCEVISWNIRNIDVHCVVLFYHTIHIQSTIENKESFQN